MKIHLNTRTTIESFNDLQSFHMNIENIGTNLSNLCRFNGATGRYYSVAEHSIILSTMVPTELRKIALLHDAHEAFIGDIVRPVQEYINAEYLQQLKDIVDKRIEYKFSIERGALRKRVTDYDDYLLMVERYNFFSSFTEKDIPCAELQLPEIKKQCEKIKCLYPAEAYALFLETWKNVQ